MHLELAELGSAPTGFFTRSQALGLGLLDRDLTAALRRAMIVRLRPGAYTLASHHQARDESERYRILTRAAIVSQRGPVAAFGPSAAVLLGLPLYDVDLSEVHLVRLDSGSPRRESGVQHHVAGNGLADDLVQVDGMTVTGPARTAWDVSRMAGLVAGVVTADAVCHQDHRAGARLAELARMLRHQPYARRAMLVTRMADGRSESAGESVSRVQFHRYGVPTPTLQYEVRDEDGTLLGCSDFAWPEFSHLGEFDGKIKYGRLLRPGETPSDAVVREKVREDGMRSQRYGMSRFVWAMIMASQVRRSMTVLGRDLERSRSLYGSHRR